MEEAMEHTPHTAALTKGKRTKRPRPAASSADEDMAHCLILLARGCRANSSTEAEACAAPAGGKTGPDSYACKTCGKRFPSFQALGGHCTSHKKPRPAAEVFPVEKEEEEEEERAESGSASVSKAEDSGGAGPRMHECSVCGEEFTSGQALGGHMRRHRPMADVGKEKATLELDLNLPAAHEEGEGCEQLPPPAAAAAMGRSYAFLSAALVGCHY